MLEECPPGEALAPPAHTSRRQTPAWQRPVGQWLRRLMDAPVFLAIVAMAGLAVGRMLTPDPRGLGTHESLGLPPCMFRYATGLPCPGCGMTTAVSHAAHGDLGQSFLTQPAGFLVGVGLWIAVPLMLFAAWRRLPVSAVIPSAPRHPLGWGIVIFPIMFAAWVYKLIVVVFLS